MSTVSSNHVPGFRKSYTCISAGANVGYASVLYAHFAPDARIVSIEPHPDNFKMLQRNVQALPNVRPVHAALWRRPANVSVVSGNRRSQQVSGSARMA